MKEAVPLPPPVVAEEVVEKPKKGRKPKAVEVKETATVVSEGEAVAAPAPNKGRKPKSKETAPVPPAAPLPTFSPPQTEASADPDDEELPVNLFLFNGVQFLIDDLHNVYDFQSQELLGVFDHSSQSLRRVEP